MSISKKNLETLRSPAKPLEPVQTRQLVSPTLFMLFCTIVYVLSILLSVTPLSRIPDKLIHLHIAIGTQLPQVGAWLPADLGVAANHLASTTSTAFIEFLLLIALAFAAYGLCALSILRQKPETKMWQTLSLIWLGTIVAGSIYVLTSALLSNDFIVYASYGRVLATYHANPYFVPQSAFPQDPLYSLNYWAHSTAAYGPIWLLICAFWALILSPNPVQYILAFRLFAFAAHLCNIFLVTAILRTMGRSPRTIALGTLLYAWNPLVLLESCLNGHNDVFMVTFILLGILLTVRAEQKGSFYLRNYLLPLITFILSALIKFITIPLILLFLILLAAKVLRSSSSTTLTFRKTLFRRWQPALTTILVASSISIFIDLLFYIPFWLGHTIPDILFSFTSPPSARSAENSIMQAIYAWNKMHPVPSNTLGYTLLQVFSLHQTWNYINFVVLSVMLIIGAIWLWQRPTARTLILASLATLGTLLLVTPWFYSWYVIWLVGLAAVCLPVAYNRIDRALVALTLTFSASALLTYLFLYGYPPFGTWTGFVCLTTIGPSILAFLITIVRRTVCASYSSEHIIAR